MKIVHHIYTMPRCYDVKEILSSCGTSRKPKLVKPETSFSGKDCEEVKTVAVMVRDTYKL